MKFYLYSKPVFGGRDKRMTCMIVKLSAEIIPELDEELIRKITLNRKESHFYRLKTMLESSGDSGDNWYVLDDKRTEKDLIQYMNTWK